MVCPWDFPGKNTGVGCHVLLQQIFLIFLTQESNPRLLPHLLPCRQVFTAESSILGILKDNILERIWNKRSISTWLWYFINNYYNDIYSLPPSSFSPWITFKTTEKIKLNESRCLVNMYGIIFVKNLEILTLWIFTLYMCLISA